MTKRGATLLELIIAITLATVCVVSLSLIFPKATKTISNNRQRAIASSFATARLQEITQQTYPYIATTVPNTAVFTYVGGVSTAGGCDCKRAVFSAIPFDASDASPTMSEGNVTYTRKSCVNYVERNPLGWWNTYCPDTPLTDAADKGLKSVVVRVTWQMGDQSYQTELETMVSR